MTAAVAAARPMAAVGAAATVAGMGPRTGAGSRIRVADTAAGAPVLRRRTRAEATVAAAGVT